MQTAVRQAYDDETDEAAMAEADAALLALAEEYPAYAEADLADLRLHLQRVEAAGGEGSHDIEAMHVVAHNIKGQGSCFGYDLITSLGEALCGRLRNQTRLEAPSLSEVRRLVEACSTVLTHRLTGDGGTLGKALMARVALG